MMLSLQEMNLDLMKLERKNYRYPEIMYHVSMSFIFIPQGLIFEKLIMNWCKLFSVYSLNHQFKFLVWVLNIKTIAWIKTWFVLKGNHATHLFLQDYILSLLKRYFVILHWSVMTKHHSMHTKYWSVRSAQYWRIFSMRILTQTLWYT